jgi:transcription elongation factor B subunit 2
MDVSCKRITKEESLFNFGFCILILLLKDVFLMIRRKKVTIFTDAKESTTVLEVKKIVEGIVKQKTEDQRLYKDDQVKEFLML